MALGVMEESNIFNGSLGLIPQSMANKKLTWEESDQYDLGLDLQMLDYRLKLKLDYYYKYSSKLLMQSYLPGNVFLATNMWDNASAISNEGIEFEAQYDVIRKKNWNWSVGFNLSHNKNMLRKTYNGEDLNDKVLGSSSLWYLYFQGLRELFRRKRISQCILMHQVSRFHFTSNQSIIHCVWAEERLRTRTMMV